MKYSSYNCFGIVSTLRIYLSSDDMDQLRFACRKEREAETSDELSRPMVWIGIYIAVASFFCVAAMAADLFHGFRNKKFWFPCRYFSLNAASITVIAITMKLPVDLTTTMQDELSEKTKLGSLAFLCVMMANLMPSLASMDNDTLLANVLGLSILVITVIVNICIQMKTHAIDSGYYLFDAVRFTVVSMLILLLIIIISTSITIPTSKEILEFKYQARNIISLTDESLHDTQMSAVEKLRKYVTRYWVMAETGSPQFVMTSNPLFATSGIISVIVMILNSLWIFSIIALLKYITNHIGDMDETPYKWTIVVILLTQSIGVIVGTIAPMSRCFIIFNFKFTLKWNDNHFTCFRVERHWTQKLKEWKQSNICSLLGNRIASKLICNSKEIVLCFCIGLQKVIVVSCKVIWLMVTILPVIVTNHRKLFSSRSFSPPITPGSDDTPEDLTTYVLQIDHETELSEKTLKRIASSVKSFISKAEKEQNNNLLKLLEKSTGFEGVLIFDTDHVPTLLSNELVNSWSMPIVTLTCIAIALPNIPNDTIESLLSSVGEGLMFAHLVEEDLNCAREYVNLRKARATIWNEMENKYTWLGNPLAKNVFKGKTTTEIVKWFADKAKEIVTQKKEDTKGELVDTTLIAANSMYRVAHTILLRFQSNIEPMTKKQLFAHLNGMIADIFCACFTNIPQVIRMEYHESVIEKREASVKVAARLLGKTTKIIERLEKRELPSMDDDKMSYIDEWRLYLKQSIP